MTLEHGVEAIKKHVHEIVRMLLPKGYLPILPTAQPAISDDPSSPNEGQTQPVVMTAESTDAQSSSWMMGPASALRILAQDGKHHLRSYGDIATDMMHCYRDTKEVYT